MNKIISLTAFGLFILAPIAKGQEAQPATIEDSQTMPQALALFVAGQIPECEALISSGVTAEDWPLAAGRLIRAKNLLALGAYAREQHKPEVAQGIGVTIIQLLDAALAAIAPGDTPKKILQLKLRAATEESLLGDSERAEQLLQEAAALEPPPPDEPLSPPES